MKKREVKEPDYLSPISREDSFFLCICLHTVQLEAVKVSKPGPPPKRDVPNRRTTKHRKEQIVHCIGCTEMAPHSVIAHWREGPEILRLGLQDNLSPPQKLTSQTDPEKHKAFEKKSLEIAKMSYRLNLLLSRAFRPS